MVEFALITPIFFFMLFGIIEFGVMMYDVTTTRFAGGEAARTEANVGDGNYPGGCAALSGCPALFGAGSACDADCQAIVAAHNTALGGNQLETVNYVDVREVTACTGSGTPIAGCTASGTFQPTSSTTCQRYLWNGTLLSTGAGGCGAGYPAANRNVKSGQMDYVQVNINFTYNWLTGMFRAVARAPVLDSKFIVRLEPQKF